MKDDSQDLNLDAAQNRETENSLKRSDETVELRLKERGAGCLYRAWTVRI